MDAGMSSDLLFGLMRASNLRARVIGNNIANYETPGYVRQVVRFEDLVSAELEDGGADLAELEPIVEEDTVTPGRPDGNNVNLELEIGAARMNRLQSELWSTLLQARFGLIKASIESSK
jgi:flagellar basal-body rod protein FlgB